MKKSIFTPIFIILLMSVMLFCVNRGFTSMDAAYDEEALSIMLHNLLPGSEEFTEEEYTGEDTNIQKVYKAENGYVIETVTAGYADDIRMMVGVSNSGYVKGVVVKELSETWGLGANAWNDVDFLSQFLQTSGEAEVGDTVDAMSGATVTSKAVARSINSAVGFVTGADVSSGATEWGG